MKIIKKETKTQHSGHNAKHFHIQPNELTFGGCMHTTLVKSLFKSVSSDLLVALKPSVSLLNVRGWQTKERKKMSS